MIKNTILAKSQILNCLPIIGLGLVMVLFFLSNLLISHLPITMNITFSPATLSEDEGIEKILVRNIYGVKNITESSFPWNAEKERYELYVENYENAYLNLHTNPIEDLEFELLYRIKDEYAVPQANDVVKLTMVCKGKMIYQEHISLLQFKEQGQNYTYSKSWNIQLYIILCCQLLLLLILIVSLVVGVL